jgi:predicted kinase
MVAIMDLVIFIGLQATGKSTFYRTHFAGTHDWISKDRLRNNRNPARRQRRLLDETLGAGRSAVVDNTNASRDERLNLIALGRSFGARVLGYFFQSRLADCIKRNRQRTGKERVPDVALFATRKRLELPNLAEGYDQLFFVQTLGDERFEVLDWKEGKVDDEAG